MGLWHSEIVERVTVIVCDVKTRDRKICWRTSRGSVRRDDDMLTNEKFKKPKLSRK